MRGHLLASCTLGPLARQNGYNYCNVYILKWKLSLYNTISLTYIRSFFTHPFVFVVVVAVVLHYSLSVSSLSLSLSLSDDSPPLPWSQSHDYFFFWGGGGGGESSASSTAHMMNHRVSDEGIQHWNQAIPFRWLLCPRHRLPYFVSNPVCVCVRNTFAYARLPTCHPKFADWHTTPLSTSLPTCPPSSPVRRKREKRRVVAWQK